MSMIKKIVVIDARPLSRGRSGIRRYLENILTRLPESPDIEWVLYSDLPLVSDVVIYSKFSNIRIVGYGFLARIMWGWKVRYWLQIDRPDTFWGPRHHLPCFFAPQTRKIVTIHDMVWVNLPETMRFMGLLAEKLFTPRSIKSADAIIAVSDSTATAIADFLPDVCKKIIVIKHGRPDLPKVAEVPTDIEVRMLGDYFLSVGTVEPRKNYEILLDGYSKYLKSGGKNKLVIAGTRGWAWKRFKRKISKLDLGTNIVFIENCTDLKLAHLYKHAKAFVMVSLGEGYGLPVAEAQDFDLPMLLSNLPVFRELRPRVALWVDPHDVNAVANNLTQIESFGIADIKEKLVGFEDRRDWDSVTDEIVSLLVGE